MKLVEGFALSAFRHFGVSSAPFALILACAKMLITLLFICPFDVAFMHAVLVIQKLLNNQPFCCLVDMTTSSIYTKAAVTLIYLP